ncbi:MBL fold metallo-hydrolase [Roseibium sp.]|uniref:MBL fold metallo-hydrolase n=1 Tax=Roseibium sp. TaxID=1936156 RepID=UPI003A973611
MSDELKITILGCGSSGGVPRIGNDWGDCDPTNPKNRRLRCSILLERSGPDGTTTVLIDTGPDMRQQVLEAGVSRLDAVIYTHAHADHLHGIDDLRQFAMLQRDKIPVYMGGYTYERAQQSFGYCFQTPQGSNYPPILARQPLVPGSEISITGKGGTIELLPVEVIHGEIAAFGFRFHDVAYLPDVSDIPDSAVSAFAGLKLWILDCLRPTPHPSHFHLETTLEWISRLRPANAILTNLHNALDYEKLDQMTPETVHPAFDGLQLTFSVPEQH